MRSAADFTFFWSTNHINGWASQWYRAPFTATVHMKGVDQEILFLSNEHWMMLQKALLFADHEIADEVLSVQGTSKEDMAKVKKLGRRVKGFKEDVWVENRERIVTEGTIHKFRQNADLRRKLFATGDTMFVEASPFDRIWGIGFTEQSALSQDEDNARGHQDITIRVGQDLMREEKSDGSKRWREFEDRKEDGI